MVNRRSKASGKGARTSLQVQNALWPSGEKADAPTSIETKTEIKLINSSPPKNDEGGESKGPIQMLGVATLFFATDFYLKDLHSTSTALIVLKSIVDSLIAGACGAVVVYPIDLIKTRLQHQSSTNPAYANSTDCFQKIIKDEGVGGLYKGIIPVICTVGTEKGFRVCCYNQLKLTFLASGVFGIGSGPEIWLFPCALAGCIAGAAQVVVANPVEKLKIRMQLQGEGGKSQGWREVVDELGIKGLYQGFPVTVLRDIPSVGIFFAVYELMKYSLSDGGAHSLTFVEVMLAGLVAGVPAAALVTPIDVVKTRWQADGGMDKYKSPWDVLQRSVREEGYAVLMQGCLPRVLRVSPQLAINLAMFEFLS